MSGLGGGVSGWEGERERARAVLVLGVEGVGGRVSVAFFFK